MTRRLFLSATGTRLLPVEALPASSDEAPLARLGIVTDIHFADKPSAGTRMYRESLAKLEEAVALWNRERIDAAIELGDFVDASPTAELELADLQRVLGVFAKAQVPRYFVLGNHCVFTLTKPQFLEAWGASQSCYAFSLKGYRAIVLDSAFTSDGVPYGGRSFDWKDAFVPPAQIDWLRRELAGGTAPVIVFIHHRLDSDDHYSPSNAPAVRSALEASGRVVAVFQGHQHINDHRQIGGIHYCTLRSMIDGSGPENSGYGILDLYAGGRLHLNGFRLLEARDLPKIG